jgi:hypothetical protein
MSPHNRTVREHLLRAKRTIHLNIRFALLICRIGALAARCVSSKAHGRHPAHPQLTFYVGAHVSASVHLVADEIEPRRRREMPQRPTGPAGDQQTHAGCRHPRLSRQKYDQTEPPPPSTAFVQRVDHDHGRGSQRSQRLAAHTPVVLAQLAGQRLDDGDRVERLCDLLAAVESGRDEPAGRPCDQLADQSGFADARTSPATGR